MDYKIKIGIPRGLYYYKYNILWKEFFKELGCDIIVSPETNFEILEKKDTVKFVSGSIEDLKKALEQNIPNLLEKYIFRLNH